MCAISERSQSSHIFSALDVFHKNERDQLNSRDSHQNSMTNACSQAEINQTCAIATSNQNSNDQSPKDFSSENESDQFENYDCQYSPENVSLHCDTNRTEFVCETDKRQYENMCIFCRSKTKRRKGRLQQLHQCSTRPIRDRILELVQGTTNMNYSDIDIFCYHKPCMNKYEYSFSRLANPRDVIPVDQKVFKGAYKFTKSYVEKNVIQSKDVSLLAYIHNIFTEEYIMLHKVIAREGKQPKVPRTDYLLKRLKYDITNLSSTVISNKTYIYNKNMDSSKSNSFGKQRKLHHQHNCK